MAADLPLRPIHLTAAPSWWPPASGWWWLAAGVVALLAALLWWWWRVRMREARWQRTFDAAVAGSDPLATLVAASALLRRAARRHDAAAALRDGERWLEWLDGDDPLRPFSRGAARVLLDGVYRPHLDAAAVAAALPLMRARYLALRGTRADRRWRWRRSRP